MSTENTPNSAWQDHVAGKDDVAVKRFTEMITATPDDIDAQYGLGLSLRGAGQYDSSIEVFNKVLELLRALEIKTEDEHNHFQMVTRMAEQQIELAKEAKA
ncbi:hypothetical protein ACFLYO_01070 [Chloroflexota bacterium]